MRTFTKTIKAELPFGAVAAACPPAGAQLWHAWTPVQEQSGKQSTGSGFGKIGEFGPSSALGASQHAGTVNLAGGPAAVAEAERIDLYRPFYTMSRRDPRAWRPPTD